VQKGMSALPPKADIRRQIFHVRFVPIADIRQKRTFALTCEHDMDADGIIPSELALFCYFTGTAIGCPFGAIITTRLL
jgi:hypothetical protein